MLFALRRGLSWRCLTRWVLWNRWRDSGSRDLGALCSFTSSVRSLYHMLPWFLSPSFPTSFSHSNRSIHPFLWNVQFYRIALVTSSKLLTSYCLYLLLYLFTLKSHSILLYSAWLRLLNFWTSIWCRRVFGSCPSQSRYWACCGQGYRWCDSCSKLLQVCPSESFRNTCLTPQYRCSTASGQICDFISLSMQ